jgi:hypothetical protein
MNTRALSICVLFAIVFVSGCSSPKGSVSNSSADWEYRFVVWNDDIYQILEDEVNPRNIGKEIGEIKRYSDFEGIYSNGFSNKYPEGTKLYQIMGVETSEYIAIQIGEQQYIKAKDNGKYGAKN